MHSPSLWQILMPSAQVLLLGVAAAITRPVGHLPQTNSAQPCSLRVVSRSASPFVNGAPLLALVWTRGPNGGAQVSRGGGNPPLRFSDNAAGVLMAFYFSDPKRAWRRKRIPFLQRSLPRSLSLPIFKRSFWEAERPGGLSLVCLSQSAPP